MIVVSGYLCVQRQRS